MAAEGRAFYKPELDLLRFVAFLLVFLYHFMPAQVITASRLLFVLHAGSEQGVQIFFVLSAFLITDLLLQEQERTGTVHIAAFYVRRMLRIWPLYFCLVFAAAGVTAYGGGSAFPLSALAYFSFLGGNWYVVHYGWLTSLVAPLWTISVEEQFYLVWPLTLRRFSKRGLTALSIVLALLAYGALLLLGRLHVAEHAVRANSFVEFQYFALGAGLALLLHGRQYTPGKAGRSCLLAASILATAAAVMRFHLHAEDAVNPRDLVGSYSLLAVSAGCIFLAFLNARLPRWTKPFVYCGRISYGLYAFHFIAFAWSASLTGWLVARSGGGRMIAVVLHAALTMVLCLAMAAVSYYCLEKPFLRLKRKFTFVTSRDELNTQALRPTLPGRATPKAA